MYYGARYYDPWVGRFLSHDPALIGSVAGVTFDRIGFDAQNFNAYSYVLNRPTVMVDPNGEDATWITVTLTGGDGAIAQKTYGRAKDDKGNRAEVNAIGLGAGSMRGWSFTVNVGYARGADTVSDLEGIGTSTGGSVSGVGLSPVVSLVGGAEVVTGTNADGSEWTGGEVRCGIGGGTPARDL